MRFYKYQGTGNDFVVIDNRSLNFDKNNIELVKRMCDRKFGVGSDGLILIEEHAEYDFNMVFYNPDGSQSFCGNGSRCAVAFAQKLGMINQEARFNSTDGYHEAKILENGVVSLKMHNVYNVEIGQDYHFLNTGSPHYNIFKTEVEHMDVVKEGREVRYNDRFKEEGTNVNFIQPQGEGIRVRTYERGVENETLSCGTGVTACALSWAIQNELSSGEVQVIAQGGQLSVSFQKQNDSFEDIWLTGPATFVFEGNIEL